MSAEPAQDKTPIKEIDPHIEPETVGVHSSLVSETCQEWVGEHEEDLEQCNEPATHTMIVWDGKKLISLGRCDEHGLPDEVLPAPFDQQREWTGELIDS